MLFPCHGIRPLGKNEDHEGGAQGEEEDRTDGDHGVGERFHQVFRCHDFVLEVLHEHHQAEDGLVGVHTGNHGQQGGNVEYGHGAVGDAAEPKREKPDDDGCAKRCGGDVHLQGVHEEIPQGMAESGQNADVEVCAPGRMRNGPESDSGNGCQ